MGNSVAAFGRNSDGKLVAIGDDATGGNGGSFDGTGDGLDPLISEDTIVAVVSEAREFLSTGAPGMLPMFQTASASTWELNANGALTARSQDVLTGPTITTDPAAPTSACWLAVAPDRTTFWVAHASGAVISSFRLNADGTIALLDGRAAGMPAVVGPTPLANADGLVDITVSSDGQSV